ncbi:MAG TPA: aspartyl protease family protein [Chthoniobacterales bacterium]|nr:aspartyl protease family protein [Chthoniobacterales bacterium]
MAQGSITLRGRLSTLIAAALISVNGSFAAPRTNPIPSSAVPEFEALPLTRSRQNHLIVHAFVNGKPALLGVDTGAPVSAIALKRQEHFRLTQVPANSKLPPRLQINGAFDSVVIAHKLELGALALVDEPLVVVDLSSSSRAARLLHEPEIDGILGADILFPTKAVLDCQKQMLILKLDPDKEGPGPGVEYRGFKHMPIEVSDGNNLYVDGAVNGAPARLMIDTGAFATLLHREFVHRLQIPLRRTSYQSSAVNLKQRGVEVARIRRLSVGSVDIIGNDVGVVDLGGLIHTELLKGSPPVVGLLGAEILRSHHGIVDFGTRTLYLKR